MSKTAKLGFEILADADYNYHGNKDMAVRFFVESRVEAGYYSREEIELRAYAMRENGKWSGPRLNVEAKSADDLKLAASILRKLEAGGVYCGSMTLDIDKLIAALRKIGTEGVYDSREFGFVSLAECKPVEWNRYMMRAGGRCYFSTIAPDETAAVDDLKKKVADYLVNGGECGLTPSQSKIDDMAEWLKNPVAERCHGDRSPDPRPAEQKLALAEVATV